MAYSSYRFTAKNKAASVALFIKGEKMEKKKIRNDIILAAIIVAAAAIALALFFFTRSAGGYAVVLIDGVETARYSLSEDTEVTITTGDNDVGYNVLKIENGKASVTSASCPDGICVNHKAVEYNGETIVCLPNKVVIRIDSAHESGVDAVS